MYLGKIVEVSPAEELYDKPIHPYTVALLGAIPIPDPRENRARARTVRRGRAAVADRPAVRAAASTPAARTPPRSAATVEPPLTAYANGHLAACHHPRNVGFEEIVAAALDASPADAGAELPAADSFTPVATPSEPPAGEYRRAAVVWIVQDLNDWRRPWRATAICM